MVDDSTNRKTVETNAEVLGVDIAIIEGQIGGSSL